MDMAIVEHEMAFPAANADRDAALRELFGLDISADALLQQELRASQGRAPSRILPPSPAIAGSSGDLSALFLSRAWLCPSSWQWPRLGLPRRA